MKYTDDQIEKLLADIYAGRITDTHLPKDLYTAIADYMKKGLYKGFGSTVADAIERDVELLTKLRENVYMFSAAKTYQEVKQIGSLIVDDEGKLRSQREFNRLARASYDNWNQNYGETEYKTCVLQGQASVKWSEIEYNKEILPTLRYSAIGDACKICKPLDGLVAPVKDPIWSRIYPLNHFNCMCVVLQETDDVKESADKKKVYKEATSNMSDMFLNNAGQTGMVFTKEHPYFKEASKEQGKKNFNLPIPKKDARN